MLRERTHIGQSDVLVQRALPRGIDLVASSAGLVILSPLFACIALLVAVSSPGGVFYRARRVGRNGVEFRLLKFRTMRSDADRIGSGLTHAGDARITPIGRVLRALKLDELPQLVNVLRGEMSLVGPRPEDPRYIPHYPEACRRLLQLRPGITSAASLAYRNESALLAGDDPERIYIDRVLPDKLAIDCAYFESATTASHLKLIMHTILASLGLRS